MQRGEFRIVDTHGRIRFRGVYYVVSAQPGERVVLHLSDQGVVRVHPNGDRDRLSPCAVTPGTWS